MPRNGTVQTIDQLQESLARAKLERQLKQEQAASSLLESYWHHFPGVRLDQGTLVPPRSSEQDDGEMMLTSNPRDRQAGKHYFAFQSESDLRQIQEMGRWLADSNVFALGPLNAIRNKVIGTGYRYRAVAKEGLNVPENLVAAVQSELDRFAKANLWNEWEQEIFWRSRRDGEAFLRYFDGADVLKVRTVEPEQIVQPAGETEGPEWSFGVHCAPDDEQERLGYWVSYSGSSGEGEEIDAADIEHFPINVDRVVRRGLSDFFCIQPLAEDLRKLMRNLPRGAALLSAIAWIEQYESATKSQVEAFADEVAAIKTTNPQTGLAQRYERMEPGTVVRTGKGKQYLPPPLASANVPQFVEIARICRMALASRWNAPESIFGDASNGSYSSLAVVESPFVAQATKEQAFYGARFTRVQERAIRNAIDRGRLPRNTLDLVGITAEPPPIVVRDKLVQTQVNEIQARAGILSPQTWAQSEDLDFAQEMAEITRAKEMGWLPPTAPIGQLGNPQGVPAGMLGEGISGPFGLWRRLRGP